MARPLRVALLQLEATELRTHERGWATLLAHLDESLADGPDLVVLPEASYPAYFLGSREEYERAGVLPDAEVEAALIERARRAGSAIACGLVQRRGDTLQNVAVLVDRDGTVLARQPKRFLWHFDRTWFTPGDRSDVVALEGTRAGLVICADTRLPAITRGLAAEGAELLIDCTAWVSSGPDPAALSSPQVEYMMPARAMETGTWIVAADKVGTEAGSIVYAGRSGVIDPRGRWLVQAPSDQGGVITATIDLDAATGPPVAARPEVLERSGAGSAAERSAAELAASEAISVSAATARVAVVSMPAAPSAVDLMEQVRRFARTLGAQDVDLAVLPDLTGNDRSAVAQRELLPLLSALTAEAGIALVVQLAERMPGATFKSVYLIAGGREVGRYRQTHLDAAERAAGFTAGDEAPPVLDTHAGRVGLIGGSEGLVPELAADLKLRGAEIVAWPAGRCADALGRPLPLKPLARSRAAEQRLYVAAAGAPAAGPEGGACLVDPFGLVQAETLAGRTLAMSADINRALTRWHRMAPGTDPIRELAIPSVRVPVLEGPASEGG